MPTRVLRVYHSAVVSDFRERDRLLRATYGYDLHLVCPESWSEGGLVVEAEPDTSVPTHIVRARGRRHPILFWYQSDAFRRVLENVQPEVVDLHEEPYSLAVAVALRAIRRVVPHAPVCLYTAQNIYKDYPAPFRQLERRALQACACAYPCSSEAGQVLRRKGFDGRLEVLPLGVTVNDRSQRQFDGDRFAVGFLGRLEPYKGPQFAIHAVHDLVHSGVEATLEIVGDGPQRDALEALSLSLDLAERITFTGAVPQVEALKRIATYDVVVVPSLTTSTWKEQFGRIPVQAMEAGTPVVAFATGSLPEVIGSAGMLVPEGDRRALAESLRRLVDPRLRMEFSERGRRSAVGRYSWQRVAAGFDEMYNAALSGSASQSDPHRDRNERCDSQWH